MDVDWDELRILLAVIRHGSLNGAARALGLTQPTISRRIAGMEERLRTSLFDRDTYGLRPTPACTALAEELERMDAAAQGVLRKLVAQNEQLQGGLLVTSIDWLGDCVLAPLLARFGQQHPQVAVRLVSSERNFNLAAREADVSIAFRKLEQDNMVQRRIASVAYGLYAAPAYLDQHGAPDFATHGRGHYAAVVQTADETWLHDEWYRTVFGAAQVALRVNGMHAVLAATLGGAAIGLLPRPLAARHPDLLHLPAPQPDPGLALRLGYHADMRHSPRLRALIDYLVAALPAALGAPRP